jgi:hypothetical protein
MKQVNTCSNILAPVKENYCVVATEGVIRYFWKSSILQEPRVAGGEWRVESAVEEVAGNLVIRRTNLFGPNINRKLYDSFLPPRSASPS